MKPPRGLSEEEAALWARVAATVKPLETRRIDSHDPVIAQPVEAPLVPLKMVKGRVPKPLARPAPAPGPAPEPGLDWHWERRLSRGSAQPDFTLDLHGHTLDQAHRRLDIGLAQAKAMGARLVLVVTGKPRPVDAADRGHSRGALRAHILDLLAAGPHGSDIAAIRNAQRRHGGEGALYLVLRRRR